MWDGSVAGPKGRLIASAQFLDSAGLRSTEIRRVSDVPRGAAAPLGSCPGQRERDCSRTAIEQLVGLALAGVATGDTISFMPERQPSLVVRILRTVLILFGPLTLSVAVVMSFPSLPEATAKMTLLLSGAWLFSALILTPALLLSDADSSSGPSDADGGGGSEPGPPSRPSAPRGGIPLPDGEQARERVRDHDRPDRGPLRKRAAREPKRAPLSTPLDP